MFHKLLFLWVWLSLSCLHATEDPLIIGTNAEFPPFTYVENNEIVGFDIDVAKEVAKRLHRSFQFKDMPFDALIPEITLGHVDFVAAGMSYTKERANRVSFTRSYLTQDPLVLFMRCDKVLTFNDLKGKTIVVVEGFTADYFMSLQEGIDLIRLGSQADGFIAVKCARADAFVTAQSTVDAFFEHQNPALYKIQKVEGTQETCCIVVPKSKTQLLIDIEHTLDAMEADGTLAELQHKWKLQ